MTAAAAVLPRPAPAAAQATATVTRAVFDGEGVVLYDGAHRDYAPPDADITPEPGSTSSDVTLVVRSPAGCQQGWYPCSYYRMRFVSPAGTTWTPGSYTAVEPGSQRPGEAGFQFTVGSTHGYTGPTPLHIDDVRFDLNGAVAAFAVRFEYHNQDATSPATYGSVAYRSSAPFYARHIEPANVVFESTPLGTTSEPKGVSISNRGSTALAVAEVSLDGAHPEDFTIVADGCSRRSIAVGENCSISVTFTPSYIATSEASLHIVDDFAPDGRHVALAGRGGPEVGALSAFYLDTEPDDPIGRGDTDVSLDPTATGDASHVYGGGFFSDGSYYHFEIRAAAGQQLAPGVYEGARRFPSPGQPGFDVSSWGWACSDTSSRFVIDDISFGREGVLQTLAVRFEQRCNGWSGSLFGQVLVSSLAPLHLRDISTNVLDFGSVAVGQRAELDVVVDNVGPDENNVASVAVSGPDFELAGTTCAGVLPPEGRCTARVRFRPSVAGPRTGTLVLYDDIARPGGSGRHVALEGTAHEPPPPPPPPPPAPPTDARSGYWMIGSAGDVYAFGGAQHYGNESTAAVDVEPTRAMNGYWVLNTAGQVFAKGAAPHRGNATLHSGEKAVSLSGTATGNGYWIFTDKGRVIALGDAGHYGDMAAVKLNGPVLDSVATPSGKGYWMVASDGGIFSFGDAKFYGSMGGKPLNKPVISMAPDPDGVGYWLVASDGGIFAFDAPFYGSMGSVRLNKPVSGIVHGSAGYLMVAEDGGIFAFGNVAFHGSLGSTPPVNPVVAVALKPLTA
ncbi:MAG: choice-of-anchor D domain-containing protein [Actinomycetota bacterium]|nr:choice-of-anchor D domain-containing protein [Actinomycetota bacterium]